MVKVIHLVRHGHHALLAGILCGRMPGVGLDALGRRQMSACAKDILPAPTAIQSSPQQRSRQSAAILARHFRVPTEIVMAFDEIDVGDWTGCSFDDLDGDSDWHRWNSQRGSGRPPNGEDMRSLQRRVVQHLEKLCDDNGDGCILIISHAEPIRAALMHYADIPLDDFRLIAVDPASVSTLRCDGTGVHISGINQRASV